ncbi:MAG TPA: hypothetical protein VG146_20445, partial [Verrucomicrobiae bacterium]|nr:hypothetical protein [Verrucomicrobiae bacterium]
MAFMVLSVRMAGADETSRMDQAAGGDSENVKAFKSFTESPPIILSLTARVHIRGTSYGLLDHDITNITLLADKLKEPPDAISQYLRTNLSRMASRLLSNYDGTKPQAELQNLLVRDINSTIFSTSLYETQRFARVRLSPQAAGMLGKKLVGPDLAKLNRLLLFDAFNGEIANAGRSFERNLVMEMRYQKNAFFVKIALNREELLASHVRSVNYNQQVAGFKVYDSLAAGWFDKDCWRIVNGWLTLDTLPDGSDHFPEIVILPLVLPSRVLNMGLPALGPATVKWSGNSTQGTDWLGRVFKAKLQVNGSGRPTGLSIEYPQEQPHAGRSLNSQIE